MHDWSNEVVIETPEQIDVALEIAGLGSRFVARMWDWFIQGMILCLFACVMTLIGAATGLLNGSAKTDPTASLYLLALLLGGIFAIQMGYDLYYEINMNGQTPGKKMAGIRVIREGGGPIDFMSSAIRNVLRLADMLPLTYLLGVFLILVNKRGQRLGDIAADTLVIRERSVDAPVEVNPQFEQLASINYTFTAEQLTNCGSEARMILRSFFQRFGSMEPPARANLATVLTARFLRASGLTIPAASSAPSEPLVFLASLYRDLELQARHDR